MSSVLIVDDNPGEYHLLIEALKERGIKPQVFDNGKEAWWHLTTSEVPGFIMTDYNMPKFDGLHLLELIHGDPKFLGIPTAMTTFSCKKEVIDRVKAMGGIVLGKPIAPKTLVEQIVQTLENAREDAA